MPVQIFDRINAVEHTNPAPFLILIASTYHQIREITTFEQGETMAAGALQRTRWSTSERSTPHSLHGSPFCTPLPFLDEFSPRQS
jgi:hypothetical protein